MIAISFIGIACALTLMAILIFKGIHPAIVGPIAALLVCITSGLDVLPAITVDYISGVAGFFTSYFLIFMLGNIFGNIYQITGAASKIGNIIAKLFGAKKVVNCMIASALVTAVLSYGGINSFVIIFAAFPIALKLFEEADIPTHLLPPILCGGMWTFAMTGPFTPQIPNIVSMQNLGTPSYAGLVPGVITSIAMFVLIIVYMTRVVNKCKAQGMHFEKPANVQIPDTLDESKLPNGMLSIAPLLVVVLGFNLTEWGIIPWLTIGNLLAIALFWRHIPKGQLMKTLSSSAASAVAININTAAIVGFGAVSKLTPFYAFAVETLTASTANPYVVAAVGSNIFAGILGSSSGGLALMFSSLKDTFLAYGQAGYNLEFIHRLLSFGSGGLDSLPWNGSIISIFNVCGTTHKLSYKHNFMTCGTIPVVCTFLVCLPICMLLG